MWDDTSIWDGARQGKLLLRVCRSCGKPCHPPVPMCPHCQSVEWDLRPASGRARLKSWLVSIRPDRQNGEPRITIVVDLEEGPRFLSNLVGAGLERLHEGMELELCFENREAMVLPVFRPVERSA